MDAELMHRALMNVLTNAVLHGSKAENQITLSVRQYRDSEVMLGNTKQRKRICSPGSETRNGFALHKG